MAETVDRQRLYSLAAAAALLPSPRQGKRVHPETLRRWIRVGRVKGLPGPNGSGLYVPGTEIARLLCLDDFPVFLGRSRAEMQRESAAAKVELRKMGLKV
jgi:hypothetical protein